MKYDFKGPKMALQNKIFKEYLNVIHKNGLNYEITPFLMVFVNVYIHFRIWTWIRIRNLRVTDPDPAKVPDPCGSGSTTLIGLIKIAIKVDFQTVLGITIGGSDTFSSFRYSIGISEVKICNTIYDIPILF
jgi:hypothetical protein